MTVHFEASVLDGLYTYQVVDRDLNGLNPKVQHDKYMQQLVRNGKVLVSFTVPSIKAGIAQFYGHDWLAGKVIPYFWNCEMRRNLNE